MRAIVLFFLISGMLSACGNNDSVDKNNPTAKLQVVSTIKPIQAIVLAIIGEHAQSEQLIPDYASPHNYSFKPSDIRKIKNADVIFRIDEHMESQLNSVLENSNQNSTLISFAEQEGLTLLEMDDSHHSPEESSTATHDEHENVDFHIWTSPKNALVIARTVATTLAKLDTKNAKIYQQNVEAFSQTLENESKKIKQELKDHHSSQYIVFHNSWQYFANEFGLQKPIVVNLHEGIKSGAKTLRDIRQKIHQENIKCVFYDADVSEAQLSLLSENGKIKTSKIDVLAEGIQLNKSTYIHWLRQLTNKVSDCLAP